MADLPTRDAALLLDMLPAARDALEFVHGMAAPSFQTSRLHQNAVIRADALQADLDEWVAHYSEARTHQGRWCFGKTPMQTFLDSAPLAREKQNPAKAA